MKGVLRLVAAVSFGVMVASAQIFGLSTDSTGRDIYFSTYLSQRGLGQPKYSGGNIEPFKFFRLRDGALTLIEQAPSQDLSLLVLGRYSYPRASVSANGDVLAVNRLAICLSGLAYTCEAASTLIQTPRGNLSFTGNATLSANGRFAALFGNTDQSIPLLSSVRRVDLESGRATMVGYQAAQAGRVIADDGTILFWGEGGVRLSGPTQDITLAPKFRMQRAELAGDASRIVYEADYIGEIRVLDVSSGSDVSLGNGYFPTLAQDGRTFSCLRFREDKAQVWLGDALTGAVRALTNEPDGILEQTISGDGRKVVAATYQGRVLSINTITGEVTQLLGPAIFRPGVLRFAAVPGSYNEIVGTFPEGFVPDLRVGTIPAVILGRSSSGIAIQIPWEVEPDDPGTPNLTPIMLGTPEPLWEQVAGSGVYSVAGAPFPIAVAGLRVAYYALHGDWSGPITPANPASRGELIHIYGTGYGPVDPKVHTGKPTPSDGPHRMSTLCVWKARSEQNETSRTINVDFAGLAPGTTGIYQFDIRIPSDWPSSVFNAFCEIALGLVLPTAPVFPAQ